MHSTVQQQLNAKEWWIVTRITRLHSVLFQFRTFTIQSLCKETCGQKCYGLTEVVNCELYW